MPQIIYALAIACVLSNATLFAQDRAATAELSRGFALRMEPAPIDPDPLVQSPHDRERTLRARMKKAAALLSKREMNAFVIEFIDPFSLLHGAAFTEKSIDDVRKEMSTHGGSAMDLTRLRKGVEATMQMKPKWYLNGRAASFYEKDSTNEVAFWIYYDGKWRIRAP